MTTIGVLRRLAVFGALAAATYFSWRSYWALTKPWADVDIGEITVYRACNGRLPASIVVDVHPADLNVLVFKVRLLPKESKIHCDGLGVSFPPEMPIVSYEDGGSMWFTVEDQPYIRRYLKKEPISFDTIGRSRKDRTSEMFFDLPRERKRRAHGLRWSNRPGDSKERAFARLVWTLKHGEQFDSEIHPLQVRADLHLEHTSTPRAVNLRVKVLDRVSMKDLTLDWDELGDPTGVRHSPIMLELRLPYVVRLLDQTVPQPSEVHPYVDEWKDKTYAYARAYSFQFDNAMMFSFETDVAKRLRDVYALLASAFLGAVVALFLERLVDLGAG
jgi:hypothetical protein